MYSIRITRETVESWTQLIREQAALTQFQSLALQAGSAQTTFADLPELYSRMGEALTLDREGQDFRPIGELVDDYVRHLDDKPNYIPTGLSVLDKHLKLSPGNLFIIGGRPSAGKTALSLQMACEMARRGLRVCYFSLETGPDTLAARIIANRLAAPLADVKEKRVPQSELDGLADLHKLPLLIPNPLTVQHPPGAALLLYNKAPRPRQRASEGFSCCLWILSLLWLYPCSDSPAAAVTLHSRGSSQQ